MSRPRAAVLAIDGGGSKTDVALVAADGSLLATARGQGSNPDLIGREAMVRVLAGLVAAAAGQAGLPTGGPVAGHTSACLAGADLPEQEAELTALVAAQCWSGTSAVRNDTFAVLRAGLDDPPPGGGGSQWGVAVVCGYGINCVGVAPGGETTRFLSLGTISGDWGGGNGLGYDVLWWAVRSEDGRGPATQLAAATAAHFGVPTATDVAIGLHTGKLSYDDLPGLVPVLLRVAAAGDKVAGDLVARQADEVCVLATVAAGRLGLAGQPLPIVLGGSVLTARDPLLHQLITARLAAGLPRASVRIADVPPIVGAALLGLDHAGAPPAAAATLRASYPASRPNPA